MASLNKITRKRPDTLVIESQDHEHLEHYLGIDGGFVSDSRRQRPSTSPNFSVSVNGHVYEACVVVSFLDRCESHKLKEHEPVAIALIEIDGSYWYMMLHAFENNSLFTAPADVLVHIGNSEPEELIENTSEFYDD